MSEPVLEIWPWGGGGQFFFCGGGGETTLPTLTKRTHIKSQKSLLIQLPRGYPEYMYMCGWDKPARSISQDDGSYGLASSKAVA